jgi:hypothetical protein
VEVELNGKTFARGVSPTSIRPSGTRPSPGRDNQHHTGNRAPVRDLARLGDLNIHYHLKGRLQPRGRPDTVPFHDKGVISLKDLGP